MIIFIFMHTNCYITFSLFEIYSLSVCKTQNKSNYAWFSNISVKLDIVPAPHHAPCFVLPDYEMQWGGTIYEEAFSFYCCNIYYIRNLKILIVYVINIVVCKKKYGGKK